MRILAGRGYWLPQHRIAHLRRIAFLGDSFVYGQGVEADETLPACAERHLNAVAGGWPVEAVNLGVCGYNLWNAWQSFRRLPQVYDAAVLTLCCNDAQLFCRSYHVEHDYRLDPQLWQAGSRHHQNIRACFDEMAACARSSGLSLAICFYHVSPHQPPAAQTWTKPVSTAIADLCSSRGIPFIDLFAHLTARNMAPDQLVASEADYHPSRLAHDAAARHLASAIRRLGWLEATGDSSLGRVADRTLKAARDLVGRDSYPTDIAIRWATSALEGKRRAARRLQSASAAAAFTKSAGGADAALQAARLAWHRSARTEAVCEEAAAAGGAFSSLLWTIDEEMLRLEELCAAAGKIDMPRFADKLMASTAPIGDVTTLELLDGARLAMKHVLAELKSARAEHDALRKMPGKSPLLSVDDLSRFSANLGQIGALSDRLEAAARTFADMLTRLKGSLPATAERLPPDEGSLLAGLLRSSFEHAIQSFQFARKKLASATDLPAQPNDDSHVEVTLTANAIEERQPCTMEIQVNYLAPRRLPLQDRRQFLPRGTAVVVALRFPVIYAGQLSLSFHYPATVAGRVEADLVKVEVRNSPTERRSFHQAAFSRQGAGKYISPIFYLV